jgi:LysR family nitrogen assimilation transcriptional regulator
MQINQLRYFVHVAELGSFSKAATHLHVAQPAISRQIGLLERELGVSLLYRHGRGARPTVAGTELLNRAAHLLQQVQEAREAVMACRPKIEGDVRIGLPTWAARMLLPGAVLHCRREHPMLAIRAFESSSVTILEEWLLSGRIDMAVLGASPLLSRNLSVAPLMRQAIALIGRIGTPPPSGACSLRNLGELPLILSPAGHGVRTALDAAALQSGFELRPEIEVDSFAVMKELVLAGSGYALLPQNVVRAEVDAGSLWAMPLVRPRVERELLLASSVERPLTGSGRVIHRVLMELASQVQSQRQVKREAALSLARDARPRVGCGPLGNAPSACRALTQNSSVGPIV